MRIAYIYPALTTVGGADRIITEKANYFADKFNFEVYIITAHQNNAPLFFPLSPRVKHIDLDIDFNKQYNRPFIMRGLVYFNLIRKYKKKLSDILCSIKPDFTITTISRDIDFLTSIKDGSKKIAEAHVSKEYIRNIHLMREKSLPYRIVAKIWTYKLEKAIKKFSTLVVLTSEDAKQWSLIKKAIIIPNALPFYPTESSSCTNKRIISVGRLNEQKGYDMLIEAWSLIANKYPDWSITIFGNGELRNEIIQKIKDNNLENSIIIEEPVNDICSQYLSSSLYIMSSRFEGFGMVLAEAMACGVPCISFNCPHGPSDIITNNIDGLLVKNKDIQDLAKKISFLLDNNDIRIEMGKNAKKNIKRYLPDNIMLNWIKLFENLSDK